MKKKHTWGNNKTRATFDPNSKVMVRNAAAGKAL